MGTHLFLRQLAALPWVEAIWLFGSRARGDHQPRSDIDLAILCPHASPMAWEQTLALIDEADTLLKIDCLRFDALAPDDPLRRAIETHHHVLFDRERNEAP